MSLKRGITFDSVRNLELEVSFFVCFQVINKVLLSFLSNDADIVVVVVVQPSIFMTYF